MSDIEQVQEQMKADKEAMKENMTTMMEAMMSIRKMMEVNVATTIAANTAIERDTTYPPGFSQVSHPVLDLVGQGGEEEVNAYEPNYIQVQSKFDFPPYGLPPNYTPPIAVYALGENIGNSAPIFIESQQPQLP